MRKGLYEKFHLLKLRKNNTMTQTFRYCAYSIFMNSAAGLMGIIADINPIIKVNPIAIIIPVNLLKEGTQPDGYINGRKSIDKVHNDLLNQRPRLSSRRISAIR